MKTLTLNKNTLVWLNDVVLKIKFYLLTSFIKAPFVYLCTCSSLTGQKSLEINVTFPSVTSLNNRYNLSIIFFKDYLENITFNINP